VAKILPLSENNLSFCAKELKKGNLVAFPTETVFGLGAHACDENAVQKIFKAKNRPKSDPLIIHVHSLQKAESLTNMTAFQKNCFQILGENFWPGALTLIVEASHSVPKLVTAGGDSVAIRIPNHKVALELIQKADLPIAAPSANRFGHVSPTRAQHVYDDLKNCKNLTIINDFKSSAIGIESTILKISKDESLSLLRPGAVGLLALEKTLTQNGVLTKIESSSQFVIASPVLDQKECTFNAPGQRLTHYAPVLETAIISYNFNMYSKSLDFHCSFLSESVIIDFFEKNVKLKNECLRYMDLSACGSSVEAMKNFFSYLRKAENLNNAKYILLADVFSESREDLLPLCDRVLRAASGKFVKINFSTF
jgi:L-threonylcarbamoyladenylate synthase